MGLPETILFYLFFGAAVAVTVLITTAERRPGRCSFIAVTAIVFWPLYLPGLLTARASSDGAALRSLPTAAPYDELESTIVCVESELDEALLSLADWSEGESLIQESNRFQELRAAWRAQADRIRELDRLLAQVSCRQPATEPTGDPADTSDGLSSLQQSLQTRLENIETLREIRRRLNDELRAALARVSELATMIHIAKFSAAPASRAAELVQRIAAADRFFPGEGLSRPCQIGAIPKPASAIPAGVNLADAVSANHKRS